MRTWSSIEQKNDCFSLISGTSRGFFVCDSNCSLIKTTCDGILKPKNLNFDIWCWEFLDNWLQQLWYHVLVLVRWEPEISSRYREKLIFKLEQSYVYGLVPRKARGWWLWSVKSRNKVIFMICFRVSRLVWYFQTPGEYYAKHHWSSWSSLDLFPSLFDIVRKFCTKYPGTEPSNIKMQEVPFSNSQTETLS